MPLTMVQLLFLMQNVMVMMALAWMMILVVTWMMLLVATEVFCASSSFVILKTHRPACD